MDTVTESSMAIAMATVRSTGPAWPDLTARTSFLFRGASRRCRLLTMPGAVQLGGMGFIHYNCTAEEQLAHVKAVKSYQYAPAWNPTWHSPGSV